MKDHASHLNVVLSSRVWTFPARSLCNVLKMFIRASRCWVDTRWFCPVPMTEPWSTVLLNWNGELHERPVQLTNKRLVIHPRQFLLPPHDKIMSIIHFTLQWIGRLDFQSDCSTSKLVVSRGSALKKCWLLSQWRGNKPPPKRTLHSSQAANWRDYTTGRWGPNHCHSLSTEIVTTAQQCSVTQQHVLSFSCATTPIILNLSPVCSVGKANECYDFSRHSEPNITQSLVRQLCHV